MYEVYVTGVASETITEFVELSEAEAEFRNVMIKAILGKQDISNIVLSDLETSNILASATFE